ncbi:uncharacterized protein LOC129570020 [Sitodiplosis mosellana]|uniref:uncharacterized protein LOC129570020 n=1 Tax=Sitodiplosis mosellana TaxID=263140 RepID=UPI0024453226|nr:uncharacterized protein LOC129570020 [Sitodiplosis mosellana]
MDMNNSTEDPPAKKIRYDAASDVNPPKTVNPLLLRSLQKVSHLLSSEVKSKYGIKSPNEESSKPWSSKPEQPMEEAEQNRPNGPNLMVLDDDCLMELFVFLKPMHLAHLAHVNVRLNKLVKRYIQCKYKIRFAPNFNISAHDRTVRINLEVLQAFLYIFGEDIVTLTLHNNVFDGTYDKFRSMSQIQDFIQKYCHLKELAFVGFGMCGLTNQFYTDLKSLTLDDCSVTRSWANMKQLKTLKLNTLIFRRYPMEYISRENYDWEFRPKPKPIPIPTNCFGALEELQLNDVNIDNGVAAKLINSNRNLKRLSIVKCREISPFIFEAVGRKKNLEEFEFKTQKSFYSSGFAPLMSLKKLKVLKLFHQEKSLPQRAIRYLPKGITLEQLQRKTRTLELVNNIVKNGITLDHLELGLDNFDDETAASIAKMSTIKILKFSEMAGLNESHIATIAELQSLKELQVKTKATISQSGLQKIVRAANRLTCLKVDSPGFLLDVETYQAILGIIQKRTIQTKLELTIYGNGNQLAVPNEMLNGKNEEWFTVKELNRARYSMFEDLTSKIGQPPPQRDYYSSDSDDSDYYY